MRSSSRFIKLKFDICSCIFAGLSIAQKLHAASFNSLNVVVLFTLNRTDVSGVLRNFVVSPDLMPCRYVTVTSRISGSISSTCRMLEVISFILSRMISSISFMLCFPFFSLLWFLVAVTASSSSLRYLSSSFICCSLSLLRSIYSSSNLLSSSSSSSYYFFLLHSALAF